MFLGVDTRPDAHVRVPLYGTDRRPMEPAITNDLTGYVQKLDLAFRRLDRTRGRRQVQLRGRSRASCVQGESVLEMNRAGLKASRSVAQP